MSQYQYYEFRAIDRALTRDQIAELRRYSSRAQITPNSFVNVYHYGDFRGDPESLVRQYFDAFLYVSNWGTRWLLFRVPERLVDAETLRQYSAADALSYETTGDTVVISLRSDDETSYEWEEGDGWLPSLMQIRQDLLGGDHRALYLGWLLAVQADEVDDEDLEPPVPPGLGNLSRSLATLVDFLRIDIDLVAAAGELNADSHGELLSAEDLVNWVSTLPEEEKDRLLARVITNDDPHLSLELRRQAVRQLHGDACGPAHPHRTASDLVARAEILGKERQRIEAEKRAQEKARQEREAAIARERHLDNLVGQESKLWAQVTNLISTKQPKKYDEAVSTLIDLRDLNTRAKTGDFGLRIEAIRQQHARKPSFIERLKKARL